MELPDAPPMVIVAIIIAFWLCQPFVMEFAVLNKPRFSIGVTVVAFIVITSTLGIWLQQAISRKNIRPLFLFLVWYPLAMQFLRYLHAFAIGGNAFARQFGLTSRRRITIFTFSVATVIFENSDAETKVMDRTVLKHKVKDSSISEIVRSSLLDLVQTGAVCAGSLILRLDVWLPIWAQQVIRIYIMGVSTSILRLALEVPTRLSVRNESDVKAIIPIYEQPQYSSSPRDLWRRWSVTGGYHLRYAYYEPMLQYFGSKMLGYRILATVAPFAMNTIMHITWWSTVIVNRFDGRYVYLLFMFPLLTILIQDTMDKYLFCVTKSTEKSKNENLRNATHLVVLWIGLLCIGRTMADVHGLAEDLGVVCRNNLGLSKVKSTL